MRTPVSRSGACGRMDPRSGCVSTAALPIWMAGFSAALARATCWRTMRRPARNCGARALEIPDVARACPRRRSPGTAGATGGTEWNGPAYSPDTNLLYDGTVDWCVTVTLDASE